MVLETQPGVGARFCLEVPLDAADPIAALEFPVVRDVV